MQDTISYTVLGFLPGKQVYTKAYSKVLHISLQLFVHLKPNHVTHLLHCFQEVFTLCRPHLGITLRETNRKDWHLYPQGQGERTLVFTCF